MPVHPLTNALVRGKRLALGLALATTVSLGTWAAPFTTTAHAESVRVECSAITWRPRVPTGRTAGCGAPLRSST